MTEYGNHGKPRSRLSTLPTLLGNPFGIITFPRPRLLAYFKVQKHARPNPRQLDLKGVVTQVLGPKCNERSSTLTTLSPCRSPLKFRPNLSAILCPRAGMQLVRYWKSQGPERAGTVGNDGTGGPTPRFRNAYAGGCFSAGARSLQLHCRRSQSRYGHGGPAACGDAELVTCVQGIKVYRYKVSHLSYRKQRRGEGGAPTCLADLCPVDCVGRLLVAV